MMICFRETTFWAKTSLSFVFRGPNSVHPEVFRCMCSITMVQISKLYDDLFVSETTFWAKTSLSFVFRGPNSVHPEVFRCANHNGTNFKAVWWSVSEKKHFGLKHYFPLYLEGQTQCTLRFSGMPIIMVQVQRCMMICFRETTFWAKTSLSFVFRGPNSVHPESFSDVPITMIQISKLYDDLFLRNHILG